MGAAFAPGDRVVVTSNNSFKGMRGTVDRVTRLAGPMPYEVRFDGDHFGTTPFEAWELEAEDEHDA